ncbi:glycosyltransferase [candidate division KSB1 bacterium]|nr:glycosyltransferase [candidate division KSB1 bacterium]
MKILHFAVENYARVPARLAQAERELGHESLLVTLYPSKLKFHDEDICLNLPFVIDPFSRIMKGIMRSKPTRMSYQRKSELSGPPIWKPRNPIEKAFFQIRDALWEKKIRSVLNSIDVNSYDLLVLEGGSGFLRSGKIVHELKQNGMPIAILYCGSDLRTRGIIPSVDEIADFRFTVEFDHTLLDPSIHFLFFPFRLPVLPEPQTKSNTPIRIGHSPTNRAVKGTDEILAQLELLKSTHPIEIVLIENLPYEEALSLKQSCHLFVETIGELGYGISGLEALAMGIPTACEILPDYASVIDDHPFINVNAGNIAEKLIPFIKSLEMRDSWGEKSRNWVQQTHDPKSVVQEIHRVISL